MSSGLKVIQVLSLKEYCFFQVKVAHDSFLDLVNQYLYSFSVDVTRIVSVVVS